MVWKAGFITGRGLIIVITNDWFGYSNGQNSAKMSNYQDIHTVCVWKTPTNLVEMLCPSFLPKTTWRIIIFLSSRQTIQNYIRRLEKAGDGVEWEGVFNGPLGTLNIFWSTFTSFYSNSLWCLDDVSGKHVSASITTTTLMLDEKKNLTLLH